MILLSPKLYWIPVYHITDPEWICSQNRLYPCSCLPEKSGMREEESMPEMYCQYKVLLLAKNLPSFPSCIHATFHPFMLPFWQDTHKNSLLSLDNFGNYFFNSTTVLGDNLIGSPLVWPQSLTFRLYMLICMCHIYIYIGMYVICIGITYTSEQLKKKKTSEGQQRSSVNFLNPGTWPSVPPRVLNRHHDLIFQYHSYYWSSRKLGEFQLCSSLNPHLSSLPHFFCPNPRLKHPVGRSLVRTWPLLGQQFDAKVSSFYPEPLLRTLVSLHTLEEPATELVFQLQHRGLHFQSAWISVSSNWLLYQANLGFPTTWSVQSSVP